MKKLPCTRKTFVANRVALILENLGNQNWAHVASQENPADLETRGLTPEELKDSKLWWNGPSKRFNLGQVKQVQFSNIS